MIDQINTALANAGPHLTAAIVKQICGPDATPIGMQAVERIGRKQAGAGTKGIYRVSGTATDHGQEVPWSAVVKVVGGSEGYSQDPNQSWEREIEAYRSGVFAELRRGFRAARCYGVQRSAEDTTWLWLEDLTEALFPPWPNEQYAVSARHLGAFNAHFTGKTLPEWDWLSPVQRGVGWRSGRYMEVLGHFADMKDHPFMRAILSSVGIDRVLRLPDDCDRVQPLLGNGDVGMCHWDAHPKNFFVLNHDTDGPTTVAADWSMVGTGPLGADLGLLLLSPLNWLEITTERARELIDPVFDGYLQGLRDSAWEGDESLVRLEFLAHFGLFGARRKIIHSLRWATNESDRELIVGMVGQPIETILAAWGDALELLIEAVDEAIRLAQEIRARHA